MSAVSAPANPPQRPPIPRNECATDPCAASLGCDEQDRKERLHLPVAECLGDPGDPPVRQGDERERAGSRERPRGPLLVLGAIVKCCG